MTFSHLDQQKLDRVREAAIAAGFNNDEILNGLAADVNSAFRGQFMVGANPNVKLHTITSKMNSTRNLVSGEVPFALWLSAAIRFAGGTPEELVFREALAEISPDSVRADGQPVRPADLDAVPERSDGSGLEIAIGEDDTLGVEFLIRGVEAARSVARLRVHRHFDGQPSFAAGGQPDVGLGTAWLIAPDLIVTNHHVVRARAKHEPHPSPNDFAIQATSTSVEFDAYSDGSHPVTASSLGVVCADEERDYAIIRLASPPSQRSALRVLANPMTRVPTSPLRERANVLQHPNGLPMRLGFRNNFVLTASAQALSYLTDTAGGSSGSPICDDAWFVAGLHRGWQTIIGQPAVVWGTTVRQENFATPIGVLLAHVRTTHPEIGREIDGAQEALR